MKSSHTRLRLLVLPVNKPIYWCHLNYSCNLRFKKWTEWTLHSLSGPCPRIWGPVACVEGRLGTHVFRWFWGHRDRDSWLERKNQKIWNVISTNTWRERIKNPESLRFISNSFRFKKVSGFIVNTVCSLWDFQTPNFATKLKAQQSYLGLNLFRDTESRTCF